MGRITPEKLEAMRSVGFINGPLPSKPKVREFRDQSGARAKATTDELGHTVTQRGNDRQDVQINAQPVHLKAGAGLTPKE